MAKAKPAKSTKPLSAATTKMKSVKASAAAASKSNKAAKSNTTPLFTGVTIGHAAGDVWGLLQKEGGQSIAAIKKGVAAPPEIVTAAIGWLAREDKLQFDASGRTVKISLR